MNRAWVGDITFIATGSGWLYLAVLLDFVFPTSGGLGDERTNRSAVGLGCFDHGVGAMASATRTDPSYRSGAVVLQYGLCRDAEKAWHGAEPEPERKLLRQRGGGELL